jgi:sporulation protein YabP
MEKVNNYVKSTIKTPTDAVSHVAKPENLSFSTNGSVKNHRLELDGQQLLSVSGVKGVPTFGDKEIKIQLDGQILIATGHNLEIKLLDLEKGQMIAKGVVTGLRYTTGSVEKGLLKKIFK